MPVAGSIHWRPVRDPHYVIASLQPGQGGLRQLFVAQPVLVSLQVLARAQPADQLLGLLIGRRWDCPLSGKRWLVIESLIEGAATVPDVKPLTNDLRALLPRRWRDDAECVGWYCGTASADAHLSRTLAAVHAATFADSWQTALVLANNGKAGAFFLHNARESQWFQAPFYELIDDSRSARRQPAQPTSVSWPEYLTAAHVAPLVIAEPPAPPRRHVATAAPERTRPVRVEIVRDAPNTDAPAPSSHISPPAARDAADTPTRGASGRHRQTTSRPIGDFIASRASAAKASVVSLGRSVATRAAAAAQARAERAAQAKQAREAQEAEERRRQEERARQEAQRRAEQEAARAARREAERVARLKAAERARKEAAERAQREAAERAEKEAAERARLEAERVRVESERAAKLEADRIAREEAERAALLEAERAATLEAEQRARQEADQRARLEAAEHARLEAERALLQEAERARAQVAERAKREAAELAARLAAAERTRLEAERATKLEAEERAKRDAEQRAKRDAERQAAAAAAPTADRPAPRVVTRERVTAPVGEDLDDTTSTDGPYRYLALARREGFQVSAKLERGTPERPETVWLLNEPESGLRLTVVTTDDEVRESSLHYNIRTDDDALLRLTPPEHRDVESRTIYVREPCIAELRSRCRRLRATGALAREWKVTPPLHPNAAPAQYR